MQNVKVEVSDDTSRPEGGHAVLLLRGVTALPDRVVYRIKPVDGRAGIESSGVASWPAGEYEPVAVRQTELGIALVVGPEIVESPALLPGVVAVIEIPAAAVRGEFLWPSIRPLARAKRRHLNVIKPQRRAAAVAPPETPTEREIQLRQEIEAALPAVGRLEADGDAITAAIVAAAETTAANMPGPFETEEDAASVAPATTAGDRPMRTIGGITMPADLAPGGAAAASNVVPLRPEPATDETQRKPRLGSVRMALIAASAMLLAGATYVFFGTHSAAVDKTASTPIKQVALPDPRTTGNVGTRSDLTTAPSAPGLAADAARTERQLQSESGAQPVGPGAPAKESSEPAAPPAQRVTMRMRGGGFQVSGELKGFDGTKYQIETRSHGVMTMDASRFECVGEACARPAAAILTPADRPSPTKPDAVAIEGVAALGSAFMPQLIGAYAKSVGATVAESKVETTGASRYRLLDARGAELATVNVGRNGSAAAFAALEKSAAAIALTDRPYGAEDGATSARSRAPVPLEHYVGLDGVAAVVAPGNALVSLPAEALAKILAGQITDWYDLGQEPGRIELFLAADGAGTAEYLTRTMLRPRGLALTSAATRVRSDAEIGERVAAAPRGIGFTSFALMRGARALNLQTQCGLIVRPTVFGVKSEEYPLVRRLYLHTIGQPATPTARGLLRLATSAEGQALLAAVKLVDQGVESIGLDEQAERMAHAINAPAPSFDMGEMRQMLTDLDGARRLSMTFRAVTGAGDLDARSRRDIARLAAVLKEPAHAGRRIVLAGFTDANGKFQANMAAALKRANQVRAALLAAAGPGLDARLVTAKGYGSLAPTACNTTAEGQRLNRRVEVWTSGGGEVLPRSAAR